MSAPPPAVPPAPVPPQSAAAAAGGDHPIAALWEAIGALNQLDDLMLAYDDKQTPQVTVSLNRFVTALKRAQDGRHLVQGDVPLELLERMEKEGLNPTVYTMECLERAVEEVKSVGVRDAMLAEICKGVEEGKSSKKKEGGEGSKMEVDG